MGITLVGFRGFNFAIWHRMGSQTVSASQNCDVNTAGVSFAGGKLDTEVTASGSFHAMTCSSRQESRSYLA
ncbi:Uncharacterised protein [Vibrio cholerae]|nr:Uncharacterised protein [Vibrio cholerae]